MSYHPASALRDHLKPFLRLLGAWKRQRLLDMATGLLQSGASILSEGCRAVEGGSITTWVSKASQLLEHLPWDILLSRHAHRLRQRQQEWRLIVHDTTALPKPWAEKMEGLSTVYDGCRGELTNGYTLCVSVGVGDGAWDLHPLRTTLINPKAKDFRSQNISLQEHVRAIIDAGLGHDLLHVYDRGFDDEKWFHFGDSERMAWMVRLREKRNVLFRGEEHSLGTVAETMLSERTAVRDGIVYAKADIGITITHDADGEEIAPETRTYALVVVKRPQYISPMLLLLNGRIHDWREAVRAYTDYLDRFEVEHTIRLFKQTLHPSQVQLMTCERIQGLLHLQTILLDFLLREHEKGRDPFGQGLWEILQERYVHERETLILSPYVVARAVRDLLKEDRMRAPCHFGHARCSSGQLALPLALDTVCP
ncbi:hypothetical protein HYS30_02100 [Candidatus Peregrinibacteria bacterium]|nr:hypothetical protein [Candidatus Peregrinibacteria bacterium]